MPRSTKKRLTDAVKAQLEFTPNMSIEKAEELALIGLKDLDEESVLVKRFKLSDSST